MNKEKLILYPREINTLALLIDTIATHTKRIEALSKTYLETLHGKGDKVAAQNILDEIFFTKGLIQAYENCRNLIIEQVKASNMEEN